MMDQSLLHEISITDIRGIKIGHAAYPVLDVLRRRADRTIIENIMDILS